MESLGLGLFHAALSKEIFRFWDEHDYEYDMFSIPSRACAWTSVILAGNMSAFYHEF